MPTLEQITQALRCNHDCPLGTPGQVPGEGPAPAAVMFVGEAPGADEAKQGRPLVGRAGKVFNGLLEAAGLHREEVFITNLIKCRPPENRPPRAPEVAACLPFLLEQVAAVNPLVIVPMGAHALKALVGGQAQLTAVHGAPLAQAGRTYFPLYHPAAAFYNQRLRETLHADAARLGAYLRNQQ